MADYRTVHTKTWRDDWFSELPTDSKLLWLYLITNQSTSVAGIYQLPKKFIAFETGLTVSRVSQILDAFKRDGKIDFDDSVIWIKKMREYQSTGSEKVMVRIMSDFNSLPNCRVKAIYAEKYGIDTVSVEYPAHGADTDTETDTETDKIQRAACAALPRPAQTYIDSGGKFQSGKLQDGTTKKDNAIRVICETVKDNDASIELWRQVVSEYCKQWSSKSYMTMLNEYYIQGRVPGQARNGNGQHAQQSNALAALERMKERHSNE